MQNGQMTEQNPTDETVFGVVCGSITVAVFQMAIHHPSEAPGSGCIGVENIPDTMVGAGIIGGLGPAISLVKYAVR